MKLTSLIKTLGRGSEYDKNILRTIMALAKASDDNIVTEHTFFMVCAEYNIHPDYATSWWNNTLERAYL